MAFDRDRGNRGRSFGRKDFGGGRGFDRPREMTKVTCSNCGKETEVPFKPTGDRPVYCRECFAKMGPRKFGRNDKNDSRPQGPSNNNQLNEINAKLDRLIELLSPKSEPIIVKAPAALLIEKPAKAVKKKKAVKKSPVLE